MTRLPHDVHMSNGCKQLWTHPLSLVRVLFCHPSASGVNPGFTPWFWLVSDPQQWMWSWTVQFLTATEYPSIVSLSYGLPEIDQCAFFDPSDCYGADYATYIHLVDKQFMKIGLIGVSIITATQDRGVYAPDPPASWRDNPRFTPEYPGSSAYVTSVGATEYINPEFNLPNPPPACNSTEWSCISGGSDEESVSQAISGFLSSGGFSDVDPRPSYQNTAVLNYFNSGVMLPNYTLWNQSGRGSPDVSAIGMNGYVIQQGYPELVSGASMSTPIVAGVMALIQADYQAITGTTLGFLNPMIYKAQEEGKGPYSAAHRSHSPAAHTIVHICAIHATDQNALCSLLSTQACSRTSCWVTTAAHRSARASRTASRPPRDGTRCRAWARRTTRS